MRRAGRSSSTAGKLYRALLARSREPAFYREWSVADTIDGRFDLLALHAFLLFDALRNQGPAASELGNGIADAIFTGFDEALRELGVSDFGMGRRIRQMADAFYGRMQSYGAAEEGRHLASAVRRNLYRGDPDKTSEADGMASYMLTAGRHLRRDIAAVLAGIADFGPLPHPVESDD